MFGAGAYKDHVHPVEGGGDGHHTHESILQPLVPPELPHVPQDVVKITGGVTCHDEWRVVVWGVRSAPLLGPTTIHDGEHGRGQHTV